MKNMTSLKFQKSRADKMNDPNRKLWIRRLERRLWIIYLTIDHWIKGIKFKSGWYGKPITFAEWKKELKLKEKSQ